MVLPSSYEEYAGEIHDPMEYENEIKEATHVINQFITDMDEDRVPLVTLDALQTASERLGLYAGYPADTVHMFEFLDTSVAKSYRDAADLLRGYLKDMNDLIEARKVKSIERSKEESVESKIDDVPF